MNRITPILTSGSRLTLSVKRWFTHIEHKLEEAGRVGDPPLRKVAAVVVVQNPYAGQSVDDLTPMIDASEELGVFVSKIAVDAMGGYAVQSYGKGGIVGLDGEQEHANALVTSKFAEPLRKATGGGQAWISSYTKRAAPGVTIDIPLAHKDALYVRSHYDGMSLNLPDAPLADEIAVIVCLANRGRIGARVGGLQAHQAKGDGLY
ncbi:MAG: amino acid synthesis family protein [Xanthobacteraceae bacterium]|nr:amino acid synthesis family protein [Xanthobacteraceae bacterium]